MVLLLPLPRPTHHRTSFLKICVSRHVQNGSHMEAIGACRWPNHCCCGTIGPCVQLVRSRLRCRCRCRFHPRFDTPASKAHIRQQRAAIWAWFRGLGGNLIKCAPFTKTTTPPMLLAGTVMLPSWCLQQQQCLCCPSPPQAALCHPRCTLGTESTSPRWCCLWSCVSRGPSCHASPTHGHTWTCCTQLQRQGVCACVYYKGGGEGVGGSGTCMHAQAGEGTKGDPTEQHSL